MTVFGRDGHWRTNANGTTFWVSAHTVRREYWDRTAFSIGSRAHYAADVLRRSNVGRGAQGCFVNPNAKCPVCGVPVFYYQNSHGSRVYFDDLGPPWPKHPCTDTPSRRINHPVWMPIIKRKRGQILELIENANLVGLLNHKRIGERSGDQWSLLLVEEVIRRGERNEITASVIDSFEPRSARFACYSTESVLEVGDFISFNRGEYAFFDRTRMAEVRFRDGKRIQHPGNSAPPSEKREPSADPQSSPVSTQKLPTWPFDTSVFHRRDMSPSERKHFPKKEKALNDYVEKLRPVLDALMRGGARSAQDFASGLNKASPRDHKNARWNARTARFLLSYMFQPDVQKSQPAAPRTPPSQPPSAVSSSDFGGGQSYETLVKRAMPIINRLRSRGTRIPGELATVLNREKVPLGNGQPWSGFIVKLLIDLYDAGVRLDQDVERIRAAGPAATWEDIRQPPKYKLTNTPLTREEIARRLGALGRVTLVHEPGEMVTN